MDKIYKIDWERYLSYERWRNEVEDGITENICDSFKSDLRRIIFCPALRRMHDKTQVIPLSNGDTLLTRLTHSMQVMDVAEMLAYRLTCNPEFVKMYGDKAVIYADSISAILRAASLIHDIGNPPFGHFGEVSIQNYFKEYFKNKDLGTHENSDFTEFDGNALGLRTVSKLQYTGTLDGLNLTYATLGAYLKYPNTGRCSDKYVGYHKHGVFKSEVDLFDKIAESCHLRTDKGDVKRHPLAFLVEAADSICYGVMDIEDGYNMNWYDFDTIVRFLSRDIEEHAEKKVLDKYLVEVKEGSEVKKVFSIEKLIGFERDWEYEGKKTPKDRRRLIYDFREKLIDYLIQVCVENFKTNLKGIDDGSFSEELLHTDIYNVSKALGAFAHKFIISRRDVQQTEITGNSVITGLLDILLKYSLHDDKKYRAKINAAIAKSRLEELIHEYLYKDHRFNDFKEKDELWKFDIDQLSLYAKLRVIVDFIASMTDKYSVELYQKLSGMKL